MSINAILLALQLFLIPYSYCLYRLMSFPSLVMAVISVPFVARYVRTSQLAILAGIFGVACAATAVSVSQFPESKIECAKCLACFATALFSGYVSFLTV